MMTAPKTIASKPDSNAGSVEPTALFGFFKVRRTRDGKRWNAWGALERMTTDDPITDPAEPVHFCFASTEDEAVEKLTGEMDAAYGKRRWWRQECKPNARAVQVPEAHDKPTSGLARFRTEGRSEPRIVQMLNQEAEVVEECRKCHLNSRSAPGGCFYEECPLVKERHVGNDASGACLPNADAQE